MWPRRRQRSLSLTSALLQLVLAAAADLEVQEVVEVPDQEAIVLMATLSSRGIPMRLHVPLLAETAQAIQCQELPQTPPLHSVLHCHRALMEEIIIRTLYCQ